MKNLCLGKGWRLHEAPLDWDRNALARVLALKDGWMDCELPCDIHMPLQAAGKIKDVVQAKYSFDALWTEKCSWWFVNEFEAEQVDLDADVLELTMESLDAHADIFLNGEWLGTHVSAHYPFVRGVKGRVKPGRNVLAARVTTGLETVSDEMLSEVNWACCTEESNGCPERGDKRRSWLRKPQYCVGWDWGPRAVTCGIVKPVYLRSYNKVAMRGVHVVTVEAREGAAKLHVTLEIDQLDVISTKEGDVRVTFALDGKVWTFEERDVLLTSGINYVDMDIVLQDAKLWWPSGYGAQPLYEVEATVVCEGVEERWPTFWYGVRKIELDVSRVDETYRNFFVVVNGVHIFCKGGDWIPADSIYARVTKEKYETLVSEAREAGFNMLRIWGGGLYETDAFYEACDREGILLWHDFMFGCSACPDHIEAFRRECAAEMNYQTRRLRNHASLALWCGSNEQHMIFGNPKWNLDMSYEKQYGLYANNTMGKQAVRANCPEIPYWNSSPYGGREANDDTCGDVHHWGACMMNPEMQYRIEPTEYDKVKARFVSEYGYPGPCCIESIREYLDSDEIDRTSAVWDEHNNTFEKHTVAAGIEKHYLDGAKDLNLEDYLLYAGMVQGLMLGYSLEALRFKDFCGGGLFWMYNDTWGEVGWTIVDYYLRRKISFYGVKRAFAPVKLTMRMVDGRVWLQGCNDTAEEIVLTAKVGYLSLDGREDRTQKTTLKLKPRSREYLAKFDLPEGDYEKGAFVVMPEGDACEPATLRLKETRRLAYAGAQPRMVDCVREGDDLVVTLTADAFIHGVYAKHAGHMSDNYFDLLPGQVKKVTIEGAQCCPEWHTVR